MDGKGLKDDHWGLGYLVSPYTHHDPHVEEARFKMACQIAGALILQGHFVYSPIAHTHCIGKETKLPTGWEFWKTFDQMVINRCNYIIVATMNGWRESVGVRAEMEYAEHHGKVIRWCDDCGNITGAPV